MVNVLGTEFADLDFINFRWVGWYFCSLYFLAHRCLKKKKRHEKKGGQKERMLNGKKYHCVDTETFGSPKESHG